MRPRIPLLVFRRGPDGQVEGLSLGRGRVRDLRLRRLAVPAGGKAEPSRRP